MGAVASGIVGICTESNTAPAAGVAPTPSTPVGMAKRGGRGSVASRCILLLSNFRTPWRLLPILDEPISISSSRTGAERR